MTHSKGKNKPTETIPEKDQMAGLLDNDFKTTILKMFKELRRHGESQENTVCMNKMEPSIKRNPKKKL